MTINHVHLAAHDVARTQDFYAHYFGFRLERQHGRGVFLRDASGFLIALDPTDQPVVFPPWFHLGFCLGSAAEVHALHQKALDGHARITRQMLAEPGQYASFYMADPDGCPLEVGCHAA